MEDTLRNAEVSKKGLLNAEQAADYLSVSTSYIRKACAANRIPFVRLGTRTLFRQVDLEEWISERVVPTNEEVRGRAQSLTGIAMLHGPRARRRKA